MTDIEKLDQLDLDSQHQEVVDICEEVLAENPSSFDHVWRLARALFNLQEALQAHGQQRKDKEAMVRRALDLAVNAEQLRPDAPQGYKFHGILLSELGNYISIKEKIGNSITIRDLFEQASDMDPDDATVLYCLGRWHVAISNVSFLERSVASALFATPPKSTYQAAIDCFDKAIAAYEQKYQGKPYLRAYYGKAECLLKQGNKSEARTVMKQVTTMTPDGPAEEELVEKAKTFL